MTIKMIPTSAIVRPFYRRIQQRNDANNLVCGEPFSRCRKDKCRTVEHADHVLSVDAIVAIICDMEHATKQDVS